MSASIPIIDITAFKEGNSQIRKEIADQIGQACRDFGFFCIQGHGVSEVIQSKLETLSQAFFNQNLATKMQISMQKGGRAWRGFFPVGDELTSGKPDLKEGIYFGEELPRTDPRVKQNLPLRGSNLFPAIPEFKETILDYLQAMTGLGHLLMEALSLSLDLPANYFDSHYTSDPTLLFRIFHYPPTSPELEKKFPWGVGEHTDYGVLTLLKQDDCGGLEVKTKNGWVEVPPVQNTFVCNIGDMLDYLTKGKYVSAPHRVKNLSGRNRYSFPFFFDPSFSAKINPLPILTDQAASSQERWDQADLHAFQGTYGEYLMSKISKVFPMLASEHLP